MVPLNSMSKDRCAIKANGFMADYKKKYVEQSQAIRNIFVSLSCDTMVRTVTTTRRCSSTTTTRTTWAA